MPLYASGRGAADSRDAAARRARRAREDAGDFRAFGHESVLVFPLQREDELTHLALGHHGAASRRPQAKRCTRSRSRQLTPE